MITIENFAFAPLDVAIRAGTTVTWVNFDNREHEVRILSTGDESGPIRPFSRYSYTFWTPGSYTYMNPEYPGQPWGTIDVS